MNNLIDNNPFIIEKLNGFELLVLRDSVEGLDTKEISSKMNICQSYVSIYRQRISRKMGANNFYHAIAIAFREGIIK